MKKLFSLFLIFTSYFSVAQVSVCAGSSTTLTAGNPQNLGNPTYSLNPGGSPGNNNVFVVSPNVTTTYTLYTTGSSPSATAPVTSSAVVQVTVNPQPITNPTLFQPNCTSTVSGFNLNLTFNPSSPAPTYTITWSPIPNGILSPQQSSVASGVFPGPYSATIIAAGGCRNITTFTLNQTPAPANFSLIPAGYIYTLTCNQPTIDIRASEASFTYTWSSNSTNPVVTPSVNLNIANVGTWTVTGQNPVSNCTRTYTFFLGQNFSLPTSTISPISQAITCALTSVQTVSANASPSVNIRHDFIDPQGGIFSATSHTAIYSPAGPGTFTHCLVNLVSGCKNCKTFTVTSTQGFPTFSLSSPENYTLGCNTRSVATINIINASATDGNQVPNGGPVSYTILGPPTSTATPSGSLSIFSTYTINTPGTYTVIVKDNSTFCERRSLVSILQNTFPPDISSVVDRMILDCTYTTTTLQGQSLSPNVSFNWGFVGTPGNVTTSTVVANIDQAAPTKTLINTFTLTVMDNSSTCRSTTVVPIFQNTFRPKTAITNGGISAFTCKTPTIVLTNISTSSIPPFFNPILPVIGYVWRGPTPQVPQQVSTTYVGSTAGVYTLTGKDLNNGCEADATISIDDFRDFPILNNPVAPPQAILDCAAKSTSLSPIISTSATVLSYQWLAPLAASVTCANCRTVTTNFPGIYTVTATNTLNFCATTVTMSVINGSLTATFEPERERGYAPFTVQFFNNSSSSKSKENISSFWSFGNGTTLPVFGTAAIGGSIIATGVQATVNPISVYSQPGTYSVSLYAIKGACVDSMVKVITVDIPSRLTIPNLFTPNGDGINDIYYIKANNFSELSMIIYDRWGHEVYSLTDTTNVAWDGKNQAGVDVADGTYFFVLTARGRDGVEYDEKGTITVAR